MRRFSETGVLQSMEVRIHCSGSCLVNDWRTDMASNPLHLRSDAEIDVEVVRKDETHGIVQPMRFLYASSFSIGARDTSANDVSRACRWARWPIWSTNIEQPSQPTSWFGPNMKW